MSELKNSPTAEPKTVVIDGPYFRGQAREAFTTFVAPLNGVIAALWGDQHPKKTPVVVARRARNETQGMEDTLI